MSSPTSIEAIPVEKLEQLLECTICKGTVNEPKTLPCFHSFCKSCLEQLVQTHRGNAGKVANKFHCPFCRTEFTLHSKEGLAGIASSPFICNMLNVLAVESRVKGIPCTHCHKPSVGRCVDCEIFMCEKCLEYHDGYPGFRKHSALSMEELSKPENHLKIRGRPRCKEHGDELLKYFCETCEELICGDCKEYDHNSHKCLSLNKAEKQKREDLNTRCAGLAKQVTDCNEALKVMKVVDCSLKENFKTANEKLRQRKREVLAAVGRLLDEREKYLTYEIETLYANKHTALQKQFKETQSHTKKIKKSVGVCRSLLNNGNAEEVVSSHKAVRKNVDMMTKVFPKSLKPANDGKIPFEQPSMDGIGRDLEEILERLGNMKDISSHDQGVTSSITEKQENADKNILQRALNNPVFVPKQFQVASVLQSSLSASAVLAPEFVPGKPFVKRDETPAERIQLIEQFVASKIKQVNDDPGLLEEISASMASYLSLFIKVQSDLKALSEMLFDKSVSEPNFQYSGTRLANHLHKNLTPQGLPPNLNFGRVFLTRCQEEHDKFSDIIQTDPDKACTVALFYGELLMNYKGNNGKPVVVFRTAVADIIKKMLASTNRKILICSGKLLKLTGRVLDENQEELFQTVSQLAKDPNVDRTAQILFSRVRKLRTTNWGSDELAKSPPVHPGPSVQLSSLYFLNMNNMLEDLSVELPVYTEEQWDEFAVDVDEVRDGDEQDIEELYQRMSLEKYGYVPYATADNNAVPQSPEDDYYEDYETFLQRSGHYAASGYYSGCNSKPGYDSGPR